MIDGVIVLCPGTTVGNAGTMNDGVHTRHYRGVIFVACQIEVAVGHAPARRADGKPLAFQLAIQFAAQVARGAGDQDHPAAPQAWDSLFENNPPPIFLDSGLANALDLDQLLNRFKGPVGLTVLDDSVGLGQSDTNQTLGQVLG